MITVPPHLTLVVPVYNVAPYLPRCLESIAALTPAADEIIVVDDGSTDQCPEILAAFASRLPQMRVIRQENGGLSAARNTGLDHARGKYLAFVDSDDFLATDAYADALLAMERDALDMALFNASYHFEGRQDDYAIYTDVPSSGIISGREWLRQRLVAGRFLHMVWLHLYRREFIERHRFRFVPRLIHEDVIWTTAALLAAERVQYLPHMAVHYRIPIRRFASDVAQARLSAIVASSVVNARAQATMADQQEPILRSLLNQQLVDGALSVFHKLKKMPDRTEAHATLVRMRREGFLGLLWRHATASAQKRRIARHWLRSWLWGIGK